MKLIALAWLAAIIVPLPTDDTWHVFTWADHDTVVLEQFDLGATPGPIAIDVTDCGRPGDQFRVFDNGTPVGETSAPVAGSPSLRGDFEACWSSVDHSGGTFFLEPGIVHVVTLERILQDPAELADDFYGAIRAREIPVAPTLPVWALVVATLGVFGAGITAMLRRC
jgi:hypothetical protein